MRGAERGALLAGSSAAAPERAPLDGAQPRAATSVGSARSLASLSSVDAERLEPTIQADVEEMFASFDEDRGGTIDPSEFGAALRAAGVHLDQAGLKGLFDEIDIGGNGHLEEDEWVDMMKSLTKRLTRRGTKADLRKAIENTLIPQKFVAEVSWPAMDVVRRNGLRIGTRVWIGDDGPGRYSGFTKRCCRAGVHEVEFDAGGVAQSFGSWEEDWHAGYPKKEADAKREAQAKAAARAARSKSAIDDGEDAKRLAAAQRGGRRGAVGLDASAISIAGPRIRQDLIVPALSKLGMDLSAAQAQAMFGRVNALRGGGQVEAPVLNEMVDLLHSALQAPGEDEQRVLLFPGDWESDDALELWRTGVRRYLWLDLLHETIESKKMMHGQRNSGPTEEEVRKELEERCMFWAPDAPLVERWQLFQVFVLIFTAIIVPMRAGFDQIDEESPVFWFVFDLFSDIYFYIDIVINFRTGYIDPSNLKLVYDWKLVAKNYAKGWFLVDLSSTLPVSYILYILDPQSLPWRAVEDESGQGASNLRILKILRLFRLAKMLRMLKLKHLLEKYEDNEFLVAFMESISVVKILIQLLYMSHFLACFWYLFGDMSETWLPDGTLVRGWVYRQGWTYSELRWPSRYLTAFFHSITDDTIGYAQTDFEKAWTSFQHVVYEAFMAYLTGVFAGEVIMGNAAQQKYSEKMGEVKEFLHHYQLPFKLRKEINAFYEHLSNTKTFFDEEAVLAEFPPGIRKKVIAHIYASIVDKEQVKKRYPFLARLPERLRYELCVVLKPLPAWRGDIIYSEGEYSDEMYLMDKGTCQSYRKIGERHRSIYSTDIGAGERTTLHVRGIGGPTQEPGKFESVDALRELFQQYGEFIDATVRHRIDSKTGENTSWALVTMGDAAAAARVLASDVMADQRRLNINPYSQKQAEASTGQMNQQVLASSGAMGARAEARLTGKEATEDEFDGQHHRVYGVLISKFNEGSFFGEEGLLGEDKKRESTVVATSECKIWYLDRKTAYDKLSYSADKFFDELRAFAKKRTKAAKMRTKRAEQLDARLKELERNHSMKRQLGAARVPRGSAELDQIDAIFSSLTLDDVREPVKSRTLACDFAEGKRIEAPSEDKGEYGLGGVFVVLNGEVSVQVDDKLTTAVFDVSAGSTGKKTTAVSRGRQQWNKVARRVVKSGTWRKLRRGDIFSSMSMVKKVKRQDPDERNGIMGHPPGLRVVSAEAASPTVSVLWLNAELFEFAHHPLSLEMVLENDDEHETSSDESDDEDELPAAVRFSNPSHDAATVTEGLAEVRIQLACSSAKYTHGLVWSRCTRGWTSSRRHWMS